jgi:flagellar biosynthesis protein FlhA
MMPRWADWIGKNRDLLFVGGVLAILGTIFVPLPPFALDCLLVASMAVSVLMLFTVVYVKEPVRFSVFPSLLLVTTAYRLALNVATTRQILANANTSGTAAAGQVIQAFGNFVAAAEPVIGFVIFAILVLVNFVVITKGSGRISEVAARFTLDAMPGKQLAIDSDLGQGIITADEARRRRAAVSREGEFYGAMDGASKFVRGDAVAGIAITLVNIGAGFAIGWLKFGMAPAEALHTFTIMTIGDGLVSQVPALVTSLGAGLLVTRASSQEDLGREAVGQLFADRKVLWVGAAFLGLLLATSLFLGSGLPVIPLAGAGLLLVLAARISGKAAKAEEQARTERAAAGPRAPEKVEKLLAVDPLELELGVGLVRLVEPAGGGGVLEGVSRIRRQLAVELGLLVPPVRVLDNPGLRPNAYVIKIRGAAVATGILRPDRLLAMDAGGVRRSVDVETTLEYQQFGEKTEEPAFKLPAWWIEPARRAEAESRGYTVAAPASVLETHLAETVRRHAHELLTRDDVQHLLQSLKESRPAVVEELVPAVLKPGEVQKVLQNLLREGVSIRDLGTILESLGDTAPRSRDPEVLTEYVRSALARTICHRHAGPDGKLYVITLDPKLEDLVRAGTLPPALVGRIAERIGREVTKLAAAGRPALILCSPQVRSSVKRVADAIQPGISVLSYNEVLRDVKVEALGMVAAE